MGGVGRGVIWRRLHSEEYKNKYLVKEYLSI